MVEKFAFFVLLRSFSHFRIFSFLFELVVLRVKMNLWANLVVKKIAIVSCVWSKFCFRMSFCNYNYFDGPDSSEKYDIPLLKSTPLGKIESLNVFFTHPPHTSHTSLTKSDEFFQWVNIVLQFRKQNEHYNAQKVFVEKKSPLPWYSDYCIVENYMYIQKVASLSLSAFSIF